MNGVTIPPEIMFGIIGALICAVYGSVMYELRNLRRDADERHSILIQTVAVVKMIAAKLAIPGVDLHD